MTNARERSSTGWDETAEIKLDNSAVEACEKVDHGSMASRFIKAGRVAAALAVGVIARAPFPVAVFTGALHTIGTFEQKAGSMNLKAGLRPDLSGDLVANASLGEASFDVTDGPLGMNVRVQSVDGSIAQEVQPLLNGDADSYKADIEADVNSLVLKTILLGLPFSTLITIAAVGGQEALLLAARKYRQKEVISKTDLKKVAAIAVLGPTSIVAAIAGISFSTYDKQALADPRFNNYDSLSALVDLGKSALSPDGDYQQNSERLSAFLLNLVDLQRNLQEDRLVPPSSDLIPIVLIGDESSFPCSDQLVSRIVHETGAVAVMNVGDKSDFGLNVEASFANTNCPSSNPGNIDVPVMFLPANHDSKETVQSLDKYKNVTVLEEPGTYELEIEFNGLKHNIKVAGMPDPEYPYRFLGRPTKKEAAESARKDGSRLAQISDHDNPDIILAARPTIAKALRQADIENNGFIVTGNSHEFGYDQTKNVVSVGSFASGFRGYEGGESSNSLDVAIGFLDPTDLSLRALQRIFVTTRGDFGGEVINIKAKNKEASADRALVLRSAPSGLAPMLIKIS